MKAKKTNKVAAVMPEVVEDEYTLENWKKECAEMEAEMKRDSDELRETLEEVRNNDDLDPEMKRIMLETGEKLLGADGFLKDLNKFTTSVVAHCDEVIAKCNAIEAKNAAKEKTKSKKKGGAK